MQAARVQRAALVVATFTAALLLDVQLAVWHNNFDLRVYRGAVEAWTSGGQLYDFRLNGGHFGFTYPPFAALCMTPMLLLPLAVVKVVNAAAIVLSIVLSCRAVVGRLPELAIHGVWFVTAVVAPAALVLQPVRDTLTFGQVNVGLACLVLLDLVLLDRGHPWAGVGTGLATAVKLTPGLFVVMLLVLGLRRPAVTAAATAAAVTLLAAVIAPHASVTFWTSALFDSSRVGTTASATNQSLLGLLTRLTGDHVATLLWVPGVAAVVVVALVQSRRLWRQGAGLAAFTVVGLAGGLASPISWVHHLFWLVPALLLGVDAGLRERSRGTLLLVAVLAAVLASGLPDLTRAGPDGHLETAAILGENAYAVSCLLLLALVPRWARQPEKVPTALAR